MSFDATYDACVLHPVGLRDLLVRLATTGLFRAHWSADILDEMVRSILRRRPTSPRHNSNEHVSSCATPSPTA